jgi:hypothetical protein
MSQDYATAGRVMNDKIRLFKGFDDLLPVRTGRRPLIPSQDQPLSDYYGFVLFRNGKAIFLQALEIPQNGIRGHFKSFFDGLAFGDHSGAGQVAT